MRLFVTARDAHARYPGGCVFCGHEVHYLSDTSHEPGSEASFFDRARETEKHPIMHPMCKTCATGPDGSPHRKTCKGCDWDSWEKLMAEITTETNCIEPTGGTL